MDALCDQCKEALDVQVDELDPTLGILCFECAQAYGGLDLTRKGWEL